MDSSIFQRNCTRSKFFLLLATLVASWRAAHANPNVLTPPFINLAEGRRITATATCGENVQEPELYCKLSSSAENNQDSIVVQGQVCEYCDTSKPGKWHPAEHMVDGRDLWWQSPPLSRGMKYNEVNITIDLGQEFHVAYVIIKMAHSPRPDVWALERSADNGKTWQPWQYFASSLSDCHQFFGSNITSYITHDDSVICDTQFSKIVPLEGGEVIVQLVQNRPSAKDFFNAEVLQNFTRATNVRFRLLRVKNLSEHLISLVRKDPTTTRRYFYSIKEISVGGRCICNGHADTCDIIDPDDQYKLNCQCQHNTCGPNCERCCPGFEQKRWSQSKYSKVFICEKCNCNGHSSQCSYNETVNELHLSMDLQGNMEGGGVCENCQHHTRGVNCETCVDGYYQPYDRQITDVNACQPCRCAYSNSTGNCVKGSGKCECRPEFAEPLCDRCSDGYYGFPECKPCECHVNGTRAAQCESHGGQCPCKPNFAGKYCKECAEGFYDFPRCKPCDCNQLGSSSDACDAVTGSCACRNSFGGRSCDQCSNGYFSFPFCNYCNCEVIGTLPEICEKLGGNCLCKAGYGGVRCDQCVANYTGFPACEPCACSTIGSASSVCDVRGKCPCLPNFSGKKCDQCRPGSYQYPQCLRCECDMSGTIGESCDNDGKCNCLREFAGQRCDRCSEGFYNYPMCEECVFDPAGVLANFTSCTVQSGEYHRPPCKSNVVGKKCNECRDLYWNLQAYNPQGCEECNCDTTGTLGHIGSCDSKSGQCICKPSTTNRQCNVCADGSYRLSEDNLFGCVDCGCDVGGASSPICDKVSGQCQCHTHITGRTCSEPTTTHYFPTLHQHLYEVEEGHTATYTRVRYSHDEQVFPGYSWKGYAVFSPLQNETLHEVDVTQSSLYRLILRYINPNSEAILGKISISPIYPNSNDTEQYGTVLLKPSRVPSFVTVSGVSGNNPTLFVLNPGPWVLSFNVEKNLLLDYFLLMPTSYYEANILVYNISKPCLLNEEGLCKHYQLPKLTQFDQKRGDTAYVDDDKSPAQSFLQDPREDRSAELSQSQPDLRIDLRVGRSGSYVLVVNYQTPATNLKSATVSVDVSPVAGSVTIYPCHYTFTCRSVVVNENGKVNIYDFNQEQENAVVIKNGNNEETIGIDSVVAIPLDNWSLDYIKPKPSCVRKNGVCQPTTFPTPPDSKRFDFKTGNEKRISMEPPSTIEDHSTELVHLDHEDSMIDVMGSVPKSGPYIFVAHYYQPDYPEFEMDALLHNGQMYEAILPVKHCPANSGCRAVVKQSNGHIQFMLNENFVLTLKAPNRKSIWLHYVLVIPSVEFRETVTQPELFDQTRDFLSQCGQNSFYINTSETGFCKEATFSLTTSYNHKALDCRCDFSGSLSFECEKFGGQCPCRENVIGRRCDACKTGYFGFPECQSCNCPSAAFCEQTTGECICPPNVVGEKCDHCAPRTYGYHPIIGCEECNCNPLGVRSNNRQCNLQDGTCDCKRNIEGRACDRCVAGHWNFPLCDTCECDLRGTTEEICNQTSAACVCKEHVFGQACDICKDGSFNLQENNEQGCTKCFCFGKTPRCSSASLYRTKVRTMRDWKLAQINNLKSSELEDLEGEVEAGTDDYEISTRNVDGSATTYFKAPPKFGGNRLTSYGGYFNYTIFYTTGPFGDAIGEADVILIGANQRLAHYSIESPVSNAPFYTTLSLVEDNFVVESGEKASREQLMQVLQNLSAVYVRATYWKPSVITRLSNVVMETATTQYTPDAHLVYSVERCNCPPNYAGLSCEECADGYYRASTGPFGGYCVPCQCNGHASTCDKTSGICERCEHNTRGEHCEKCEIGYHGNATIGTPNDCLICSCPLPIQSNNFATGCDINEEGEHIKCQCIEGYYGDRCQFCSAGYYGRPDISGQKCDRCDCSNNIDASDPNACDNISGECTKCLNNTAGERCNICAAGYYGDAITLKNCQECGCDLCGTAECDHTNGVCQCHRNVVGEKCDRCAETHYGFASCRGCAECQCGLASESSQCDDATGACDCKPGVTGRTCDRCAPGYWNYTAEGCVSCGCNTGHSVGVGCNPTTGMCECLPGVVGDKCDACPYRWVFVPDVGCEMCTNCSHHLLDVTDKLRTQLEPFMRNFQTVAVGYFTSQRLAFINSTANELQPQVAEMASKTFNLDPFIEKITNLRNEADDQRRRIRSTLEDAVSSAVKGRLSQEEADQVDSLVNNAIANAQSTVAEINNLALSLEIGKAPQVDYAVNTGQQLLQNIRDQEFEPEKRENLDSAMTKALETAESVRNFVYPLNVTANELKLLTDKHTNISGKISEIKNYIERAQKTADEASILNKANRNSNYRAYLKSLKLQNQEAIGLGQNASELVTYSTLALPKTVAEFEMMKANSSNFNDLKNRAKESIDARDSELDQLKGDVKEAEKQAAYLQEQARTLESVSRNSLVSSESALQAANSYKNIVDAVQEARISAEKAVEAAKNTTYSSDGLRRRVDDVKKFKTVDWLEKAKSVMAELATNVELVADIANRNKEIKQRNGAIVNVIPQWKSDSIENLSRIDPAEISENANDTLNRVKNMIDSLPDLSERAQIVSKDLNDAHKSITQAKKQLSTANEVRPQVIDMIAKLKELVVSGNAKRIKRSTGEDIRSMLDKLRYKTEATRELANGIKLGATLKPRASLEVRLPANISDQSLKTRVSLYFKTTQRNGLLFYLGNEVGSAKKFKRSNTDDFLSAELENGFPVVNIDLGSGPSRLVLNRDRSFADGDWYKLVVERTGKRVKLSAMEQREITSPVQMYSTEMVLPGYSSSLNLDQNRTRLMLGSVPDDFNAQESVRELRWDDEVAVQELMVGDDKLSLWNFAHLKSAVQDTSVEEMMTPSYDRNKLISKSTSTGCRLNGEGYIEMSTAGYQMSERMEIILQFTTSEQDGLLMLAVKDDTFFAIEMRLGFIFYQYNVGQGLQTLQTYHTLNDEQWHSIEVSRDGNKGALKVDGQTVQVNDAPDASPPARMQVPDKFYIGGYPGNHKIEKVTNIPFDGCMREVQIDKSSVDLNKNTNARGIVSGCPERFSSFIAFTENLRGYARWPSASGSSNSVELILRFKTKSPSGILAFVETGRYPFYLYMMDSYLAMHSGGQRVATVSANLRCDDDQWHTVMAVHEEFAIHLIVDDFYIIKSENAPATARLLNSAVYFGNFPADTPLPENLADAPSFSGCIGDATLNGEVINFANVTELVNVTVGKCDYGGALRKPSSKGRPPQPPIIGEDVTSTKEELTTHPFTPKSTTPTIPTPAPTPVSGCALPPYPASDPDINEQSGYRFGTSKFGFKYDFLPIHQKHKFDFSVELKTMFQNGVIFYVGHSQSKDFISVYLLEGKVHYSFSCNSNVATITSEATINNNDWHTLQFSLEQGRGKLLVDEVEMNDVNNACSNRAINVSAPYYLASLEPGAIDAAKIAFQGMNKTFEGCMKNFKCNGKLVDVPDNSKGVIPCSGKVELGAFFFADGGYIKAYDKFYVGQELNINLEIKPRNVSGLLLSVHNSKKNHYLVLQMINGDIKFTANNGNGDISAMFKPPTPNYFCDGQWHQIQAVKNQNVVVLGVDKIPSTPGFGMGVNTATETRHPLYVGGHPNHSKSKPKGVETSSQYVGCIRNLQLNEHVEDLSTAAVGGNVMLSVCSTI